MTSPSAQFDLKRKKQKSNYFHEHLKNQMQLRTLTNALARTVCVAANFLI